MADREVHAPDDPALATAARHALHDEELIAAFAGGDTDDDESTRARTIIERCPTCRDLYADVAAITVTLKSAPTAEAMAAMRPAPRDFRLTPQMAARLRGASPLARLVLRISELLGGIGRPAGMALATFGLVGVLVGSVGFDGRFAAGPVPGVGGDSTQAANAAESTPGSATFDSAGVIPLATQPKENGGGRNESTDLTATMDDGRTWLVIGSLAVLALGLAFFVIGTRSRSRSRVTP